MDFENCKNAAQFPFMQPKKTSLVPNTTPFIDFGLNLLATGRVEQTGCHESCELFVFNRVLFRCRLVQSPYQY